MLKVFNEIRPGERQTIAAAFLTLFAIMVSHTLLETARDALFLAKVSATRLPWVYLGIAAFAFVLFRLESRLLKRFESRRALAVSLVISGFVTIAIWLQLATAGSWIYYVTYVWSGVMITLVVVRFWGLVSDVFTVTQAKRVYATIGAGSVLGAITGAALARFLTHSLPTENLLPVAGGVLLVASVAPLLLRAAPEEEVPLSPLDLDCDSEAGCLKNVLSRPYVFRLLALMVFSTVALTLVDYLFKTIVADRVPAEQLGTFFSQTYLILNILSLIIQVVVVRRLIRYVGLNRSVIATPILLFVAVFALLGLQLFAVGLVLAAVLAAKGVDGSVRHSLHRTASEMLYVPLSREVRARAKSFIDVVGQRGGQAFASLLILLIALLDPSLITLTVLAVLMSLSWIVIGFELRHHYLDLFRDTLQEGHFETRIEHPDLDIASLETLIETLNSSEDAQVLAALDLLAAQDRVRLIPAMILYHPSSDVVIAALNLFTRAKREDFLPIAQRLLDNANPLVRAATVRAISVVGPEKFRPLEQFVEDPSPAVRATALVGLISTKWLEGEAAEKMLLEFARGDSEEEKIALARAIAEQPAAVFAPILIELAAAPESEVRFAAAKAMRRVPHESFLPALLEMLDNRKLREPASEGLVRMGDVALEFLDKSLGDPETPVGVRRHIPRTLRRFPPLMAAPILLSYLIDEPDGLVRYKILRALNGIRSRNPNLPLDEEVIIEACQRTLSGAFRLLDWRVRMIRGVGRDPSRNTPVHDVLVSTLEHKENETIARLFRLLGLLNPEEDFHKIHAGIRSQRASLRSSSLELLEALTENPLREALLGFLDDVPDDSRLSRAGAFYTPVAAGYLGVLDELLENGGLAMCSLTIYHIGELGLEEMGKRFEALESEPSGFMKNVIARAKEMLEGRQQRGLVYD